MKGKLFTIALAGLTIGILGSCGKIDDPQQNTPEGELPGEFSVSATKKVHFSQGNLYYDGSKFYFEVNQYDTPDKGKLSADHISHFYWSKDYNKAVAQDYSDSGDESDVFFTNETETTAKSSFTVNVEGAEQAGWRTLSTKEWQYLFDARPMKNEKARYTLDITYGGIMGLVLYPDDYGKDPLSGTVAVLPEGVVFLPAAGWRDGSEIGIDIGDHGYYWSSSAFYDSTFAFDVYFNLRSVDSDFNDYRNKGFSVRLVTDVK